MKHSLIGNVIYVDPNRLFAKIRCDEDYGSFFYVAFDTLKRSEFILRDDRVSFDSVDLKYATNVKKIPHEKA